MSNSIMRTPDGTYVDENGATLDVLELEHSTYGVIRYVVLDSRNTPVEWSAETIDSWESEL